MQKHIAILLFLITCNLSAQEHAWVYFKDKPATSTFLANPLTMLSQKALDRRVRQHIVIDAKDVPISRSYINEIKAASGIKVKAQSKWMNVLHVTGTKLAIERLSNFSFVERIEFAAKELNGGTKVLKKVSLDKFDIKTTFDYGGSINQIEMVKGDFLHQKNFTGTGMTIAVMDAGFPSVNTFTAFDKLRDNNQILGGYNFVNRSTNFYSRSSHGTSVLSTMGGYVEGHLIGTAPDANYYLFITEDDSQETPLEESLWVEAAERADSLGVDIINTSLGYTTFDDSRYDYSYEDMNGTTAFITRGAEIAFSRGMIIVNSAGNSGNKPWHYISAPADGVHVLSIGAVDGNGDITGFSSYGPTFDGRVKPDVDAKGGRTTLINSAGNVSAASGTSFSGPVMSGVIACFWQANPNRTNAEIVNIIKRSGHLYSNPTDHEGYGIPDFKNAYAALSGTVFDKDYVFYPNPFHKYIQFQFQDNLSTLQISIFDMLGKLVLSKKVSQQNPQIYVDELVKGVYILHVFQSNKSKSFKLVKE